LPNGIPLRLLFSLLVIDQLFVIFKVPALAAGGKLEPQNCHAEGNAI